MPLSFLKTVVLLATCCGACFADTAYKFSYTGTYNSYSQNVEADLVVTAPGTLQVTLYNSVSNLTYDTQVLTGLYLKFAGSNNLPGGATVTNPVVNKEDIGAGGSTNPQGTGTANWGVSQGTGSLAAYTVLTTLGFNTGGKGGIVSNSIGSSANSGLTNSNHQPYLVNNATNGITFIINGLPSTLTAASQITGVQFNWGTNTNETTGIDVTGTQVITTTPEPATYALAGLALAAVGFARRRK